MSMNATDTLLAFRTQWTNPVDISTILMAIGGDVVQKAFAQGTGKLYTPVCFSFGCVAYAFIALVNIIGDGRLLPPPDYAIKVFNLKSGYVRENKNFVLGRILRDLELQEADRMPMGDHGIRITVFEAEWTRNGLVEFSWSVLHLWGAAVTALQLLLASGPIFISGDWSVMLITVIATLLVQITGWLPQWRAEKLPNRQRASGPYALTCGNGWRDIMVIFGDYNCLDLEEFAVSVSPRHGRPWEKFHPFSEPRKDKDGKDELPRSETQLRKSKVTTHGVPTGFRVTQIVCSTLSVLWLLLLVNVSVPRDYAWFFLAIGGLGMFQNAVVAAVARPSHSRNLPLNHLDTIMTRKVMDGVMDFESTWKYGWPLIREYFPGPLREARAAMVGG